MAEETVRVHQANERTMLAWIRTGIGIMAFGFAIARFALFLREAAALRSPGAPPLHSIGSVWVGAALVALGMLTTFFGTIRYAIVRRSILRGELGAPKPALVYTLGATVTLVGIAMTALVLRSLAE
jgi:putative membrane protein